jgi:hypothetical protein
MKDLGLLELLRYALSGGIGVAVLLLTHPLAACSVRQMDVTKETTLALGSVLLIGTLIYNVHRAVVYPIFLRIIGFFVPRWNFDWKNWKGWSIWRNWNPWKPSNSELEVDRWRWSDDPEKRPRRWDEWGAQTHSLYCAAWAIWLALKIGGCFWGTPNCQAYLLFRILFFVTLFAGIISNYRLMYSIAAEVEHSRAIAPGGRNSGQTGHSPVS